MSQCKLALVLLLPFVGACTSPRPPERVVEQTSETAPTETSHMTTAGSTPVTQWSCRSDDECAQTCALGAVSKRWLELHPDADDCDDGCYEMHDRVACRDGECVTLGESGEVDPSCTKRKTVQTSHPRGGR